LNVVGEKISDASQVVVQKLKGVVLDEDEAQPENASASEVVPGTLDEDEDDDNGEVKIKPPE
jgi:hypothetical protein